MSRSVLTLLPVVDDRVSVAVCADSEVEGTTGDSTVGELETANGLDGVEVLAKN